MSYTINYQLIKKNVPQNSPSLISQSSVNTDIFQFHIALSSVYITIPVITETQKQ